MSENARIALPGSELPIHGAQQVGALPHDHQIDVIVHLRRKASSPGLPVTDEPPATHLTVEDLKEKHGADPGDVDKVRAFLGDYGLTVHEANLTTRLVHARGSVGDVSRAFGVYLGTYNHHDYNREFRGYLGTLTLPSDLEGIVLGVHGLDDRPVVRPHMQHSTDPEAATTIGAQVENRFPGAFLPPEVSSLYEFPDSTGKNQTIGIIEIGGRFGGGFDPRVLKVYFEKVTGTKVPNVTPVVLPGSSNNPSGPGTGEVYLDIEVVGAIAPDADISVYFSGSLGAATKSAVADGLTAITISYGGLESQQTQQEFDLMEEALQEAVHLGIPVFISSGDNGSGALRAQQPPAFTTLSARANVSYPSTSPYCIACGGTELIAEEGGGIKSETVWNSVVLGPDAQPGETFPAGATGGGVSEIFTDVPSYQSNADLEPQSINPDKATGRGVPDVSGNAASKTGYIITVPTGRGIALSPVGGTSAVAPLWAALSALLGEKLGTTGPLKVLVNKFLYENGNSDIFRPITEGDNNTSPPVGGYQASSGWNACCGWGSPNGQKILDKLQGS